MGPGTRSGEIQYTAAKMMTNNFLSLSFFDIMKSFFPKNLLLTMMVKITFSNNHFSGFLVCYLHV